MSRDGIKIIDYVDILPGGRREKMTSERLEQIKRLSQQVKVVAKEQCVTFTVRKNRTRQDQSDLGWSLDWSRALHVIEDTQ